MEPPRRLDDNHADNAAPDNAPAEPPPAAERITRVDTVRLANEPWSGMLIPLTGADPADARYEGALTLRRATGVLTMWDPLTARERWQLRTGAIRDVIATHGRLIIVCSDVRSVDPVTGLADWRAACDGPERATTAAVDDTRIWLYEDDYAGHRHPPRIACINLADGHDHWRQPLPDGAGHVTQLVRVGADRLLALCDSDPPSVLAFDCNQPGEPVWRLDRRAVSPVVAVGADRFAMIDVATGHVQICGVESGDLRHDAADPDARALALLAVAGMRLIVRTNCDIRAIDADSGRVAWRAVATRIQPASRTIGDRLLMLADDRARLIDLATGDEIAACHVGSFDRTAPAVAVGRAGIHICTAAITTDAPPTVDLMLTVLDPATGAIRARTYESRVDPAGWADESFGLSAQGTSAALRLGHDLVVYRWASE
ncbi:MAG: PQQ-binding-like beta-propeller repeat protein [Planctomycetota bacterium]